MHTQTMKHAFEQKAGSNAERIVRMQELVRRLGLSRTTIHLAVKSGNFPAPIQLGPRAVGWLESTVEAWLAARAAAGRRANNK